MTHKFDLLRLLAYTSVLLPTFCSTALAARQVDSIVAVPGVVIVNRPTVISILATIARDRDLLSNSVTALRVNAAGTTSALLGRMYDDGTNGDSIPGDGTYTLKVLVNQTPPTKLYYRVSVAYRGTLLRVLSEITAVSAVTAPFYIPAMDSAFVSENGSSFIVNQIIITLPSTSNRSVAQAVAASIGATIVGYSPSINGYVLQVSTTSPPALDSVIAMVRSDARVQSAARNYVLGQESANNDMENLRRRNASLTAAYDKIDTRGAWNFIHDNNVPLTHVHVGIIEQGVDQAHEEFSGVSFGSTPTNLLVERDDHGTAIAGIIGASNSLAALTPNSPQMNGLLSGVPGPSPAGSRLPYTIEVRGHPRFRFGTFGATITAFHYVTLIDELATTPVRVINMSFGQHPASVTAVNDMPDLHFHITKAFFTAAMAFHSSVLFVASAGNADVDAAHHFPGGIVLPNVMTVAATDLADAKSSFSNHGSTITIAAPGENVYAPVPYSPPLDESDYASYLNASSPYVSCDLWFCGTSAAAPLVTGTTALMFAIREGLTPRQVVDVVRCTGDFVNTGQNIGERRLNAFAAVKLVADGATGCPSILRMRLETLSSDLKSAGMVLVTDNGPEDLNRSVGFITFTGPLPGGWTVNITSVASKPALPRGISLSSANAQTAGSGILKISVEDSGFTVGTNGMLTAVGDVAGNFKASAGSTIHFQGWINPNNAVRGSGPVPAGSVALWPGGGFTSPVGVLASSSSTSFVKSGEYSLFMEATVNVTGAVSLVSFEVQGAVQ